MTNTPIRPNVLLIMCDQLRSDRTGFGGGPYIRTPHLDALAASGTVFPGARVANPICMPNRASLLTGRSPSSHGVTANSGALAWTTTTLPRQLRSAGYRTALVGKADLQNGLRAGFDPVDTRAPAVVDPYPPGWDHIEDPDRYLHTPVADPDDFYGFDHIALTLGHADMVGGHHLRWALGKGATLDDLNQAGPQHARSIDPHWWQVYQPHLSEELYSTTFVTEATISAINALSAGQSPWFIQCSFPDPHHPFTAPGRWHHRHRPDDMTLPATFADYGVDAPGHLAGFRALPPSAMPVQMFGPTPEQLRAAAAAEAGAIEFIDHGIGRIMTALDASRAAQNTIVVFTSDHGDMFGDHGLMLKGMMHYRGCLQVPLVITGPGVTAGVATTLASTLDITPTLLHLTGVDPYDGIQGVSLTPALTDHDHAVRSSVYVEEELPQASLFPFPVPASARTLVTDRYRLTRYPGSPLGELYDLTDDPTESVNRWNDPAYASQRGDLVEQLLDASIAHSMPGRLSRGDEPDGANPPTNERSVRATPPQYSAAPVHPIRRRARADLLHRADRRPEVVLEATYGWYWAVDVLQAAGAQVHLAHPLGVKGFRYRRVKNDVRDAGDLADLLRMNRLPEAWIAPPEVRELRELVRYRAKFVAIRSGLKAQVHAVLAKAGVLIAATDLFGVDGRKRLERTALAGPYAPRVASLLHLIDVFDAEEAVFVALIAERLGEHRGYPAIQALPGVGPTLGAIFVAEIGDVHRFAGPGPLCSWAGLTPRHYESDTVVHRGHITKQGSKLVRWATVEAIQRKTTVKIGADRKRIEARRGKSIAKIAAARKLLTLVYYGLRDGEIRALAPDAA